MAECCRELGISRSTWYNLRKGWLNMFYGKWLADTVFNLFIGFIFSVLIVVAAIVVAVNGGVSRDTLTGKVLEIEEKHTIQSEIVLTVADEHQTVSADGEKHIYTYRRTVFFKNKDDVVGIRVGDTITVSGKSNGYSLYDGRIEP